MRYQQNTKTLIKIFTFFSLNRLFLDQLNAKHCINWARIGVIRLNQLEVWGLDHPPQKGLDDIYHRLEGINFLRKTVIEFPTLLYLPYGPDILMTVAPNLTKLEPMETRHSEISKDIKFEETKARKGLQTITWILDQSWVAMWWCFGTPSHSHPLFWLLYKYPPLFCKKYEVIGRKR